jgi:microcin C transport system permease protein
MLNYILKRLFLIIPTLLGILAVNFIIIQAAPGGPVEKAIAQIKGTEVSVTERFTSSGGEQLAESQSKQQFNSSDSKYRGSSTQILSKNWKNNMVLTSLLWRDFMRCL